MTLGWERGVRCTECDGTGIVAADDECMDPLATCDVCDGTGKCDPIPARGRQALWTWTL